MNEDEVATFVAHAMDFYQGAEAPTANEWDSLFTALVEHDIETIKHLLKAHHIETEI